MRNSTRVLLAQNEIWVKFYHFWPKNDSEKNGLEKIFLKFLHAEAIFFYFILFHRKEDFCTKL